ncbi:hypothetical protein HYT52_04770 [Candidatus Woesearchaeota archaeon]|nr:hypothetical protein [Candidatus Woesearchaeota archaeon]
MTTRRGVLRFLAGVSGLMVAGHPDGLELLTSALAQPKESEASEEVEKPNDNQIDLSDENSTYRLFLPTLEEIFGAKVNLLYEDGYTHASKKAGDVYVISGSNQSLLVKKVEPYRSNPFSDPVLIDNSVLSLDDNQDGTYTITTGASYISSSETIESRSLAKTNPGGGSCYASATGSRETVPGLLSTVKSWQDAYDKIFSDAKSIYHAQNELSRKQKLENILALYQERFPQLADTQRWPGLTITPEAQRVLRTLGTTYNLDDVAQSLMGK